MQIVRSEQGSTTVIVLAILIIVLAGIVGWRVLQRADKPEQASESSQAGTSDTPAQSKSPESTKTSISPLKRNAQNTQRKNDAAQLASNVDEYTVNNSGYRPSAYTNGKLTSPSGDYNQPVELEWYTDVKVTSDITAQPTNDALLVIIGAACNEAKTGVVTGSSSRQFAVVYTVQTGSATFEPACIS